MNPHAGSDGELLTEFAATGRGAPFEQIVRRYSPLVFGVCRRVLRRTHDAEEVAQAVFMLLAHKAKSLKDRPSIADWLRHVAYNLSHHALRSAARQKRREREVGAMKQPYADPEETWEKVEPLLDGELDALPEKYRVPLMLHYVQQRTEADIAREMGREIGTISMWLHRGREMLRVRLARRGVVLGGALFATLLMKSAVSASLSPQTLAVTVKAATLVAAGKWAGSGLVTANVSALVNGGLKAMMWAKLKLAAGIAMAVGLGGAGAGVMAYSALGEQPPATPAMTAAERRPRSDDLSWVNKRVEEWKPKPSERRFDRIGWATDIRTGLALAKDHNRLFLLFMNDGSIAKGRCCAGAASMRAGPLSDDSVISLLNSSTVPVYASNEDYLDGRAGGAPEEEKRAYEKVFRAALDKGLGSGGDAIAYLTTPEGDPMESGMATVETLTAAVRKAVERLGIRPGKPVVEPRWQHRPPNAEADALSLHLTARLLPVTDSYPSNQVAEDWIVYSRREWTKFLPPDGAALGTSWEVDRAVVIRLLTYFYPPTEHQNVQDITFKRLSMKATLVSKDRVRLDVPFHMEHPLPQWYKQIYKEKGQELPVTTGIATAVGIVDLAPANKTIRQFIMAIDKGTYGGWSFGVAVQSHP